MLLNEESYTIELLEQLTGKRFSIIPVPEMHMKRYDVIWNE
jgi:ribonuclease G